VVKLVLLDGGGVLVYARVAALPLQNQVFYRRGGKKASKRSSFNRLGPVGPCMAACLLNQIGNRATVLFIS